MKKLFAAAFILCLVSLALVGTALGQTVTPGVQPGDYFDYHVTSYWVSSDAYASIPADLLTINQTSYVEVRISNVNTTNVDIFTATIYFNGSADASRGSVNVQTGDSSGGFVALIGSNLTQGSLIHPAGSDGITINDTVTKNYNSGVSRDANEIYISVRNDTAGATSSVDRFFDKTTGMLVQSTETTSYDNPSSTTTVTWTLINSSTWTIPEFPVILALPIILTATTVALIVIKKRRVLSVL